MYEYGECINSFVENLANGSIFETEQVAQAVAKKYGIELRHAKSVTNNQLKRFTDAGHIDRIQKGVYYKTSNTVFGKALPNLEAYAIQLLTIQNQQRIGYVTGATFMNQIGLTTQMPKQIEIVSNQYRRILPDGCHVQAKRPPVQINTDNYKYLQLLDAIQTLEENNIDAEDSYEIIRRAAQAKEIAPLILIGYARQHYPIKTLLKTVDIFTAVKMKPHEDADTVQS